MKARIDGPGPGGSGSLAELAYRQIRDAIRRHEFHPGDRMREADLADWLGISRTPMRDALKQLETEGMLEAAPRRGLVVASLDQQQVTEIYALRTVLEGLAARLAASHASRGEVDALRESLERQRRTPPEEAAALAGLNEQFHGMMYRAARNRYLVAALESLESALALLPGTTYSGSDRPGEALEQHEALVDAIEARRDDDAEHLARQHIEAAERIRLRMLSDYRRPASTDLHPAVAGARATRSVLR
jgi:DNA-binding GntR family transcriptional regulator